MELIGNVARFVHLAFDVVGLPAFWVAPAIIGIPAITLWTRHYRRMFGELA